VLTVRRSPTAARAAEAAVAPVEEMPAAMLASSTVDKQC